MVSPSVFDSDYQIKFSFPDGWGYYIFHNAPLRVAIDEKENTAIIVAPLWIEVVEAGLKEITKYCLETAFELRLLDQKLIYNREYPGPKRLFEIRSATKEEGVIKVLGELSLVEHSGSWGKYYEYFLKLAVANENGDAEKASRFFPEIIKVGPGIPFNAPLKTIYFSRVGAQNMKLYSIGVPLPFDVSIGLNSITGFASGMFFESSVMAVQIKDIDKYFFRGLLKQKNTLISSNSKLVLEEVHKRAYRTILKDENNAFIELSAKWTDAVRDEKSIVHTVISYYPQTAYFAANIIVKNIFESFSLYPPLINELIPSPPPTSPQSQKTTVITLPILPKQASPKQVTQSKKQNRQSVVSTHNSTKRRRDCNPALIKNEISNIETQLRLLEYDYKTQLEALDSIKRGEVVTGIYTMRNPIGKIRFVHAKTRSPIVGDRFWEHKDKVYLPENKTFLSTRQGTAPYMRHQFRELKWDVELRKRRLKQEYEAKKKRLLDRLAELKKKLEECKKHV